MYIIAGLGNPGKKYENTRHNMGFMVMDALAYKLGINIDKIKFKSLVAETRIGTEKVLLMKPQTYMNLSGEALREAVSYYKVPEENVIVIYDDMDIELGSLRIRKSGSAGTHNGMKSIIYQLKSDRFPRIRIGIGADHKSNIIGFVTGNVSKSEASILEKTVLNAVDAVLEIIETDIDMAMNKYNTKKKKQREDENEK